MTAEREGSICRRQRNQLSSAGPSRHTVGARIEDCIFRTSATYVEKWPFGCTVSLGGRSVPGRGRREAPLSKGVGMARLPRSRASCLVLALLLLTSPALLAA